MDKLIYLKAETQSQVSIKLPIRIVVNCGIQVFTLDPPSQLLELKANDVGDF